MSDPANVSVQPYLFFGGQCDEAIAFYRAAIGAEVDMIMRYNESPDPVPPGMLPAGWEDKVMHAEIRIGSTVIMASDGMAEERQFNGFSLAINVHTEAEADRIFAALAAGGQVEMPLAKTFWSPKFGMLTDRFGMGWMISMPA